ncbi:hypothetical protein GE21DRAFT_3074 [Neurospora crassa]|uniref:Uncharacterized protein n=2 Tax=Neurospora crassa TaxID=5141 RepID=F5HC65_NEUCR|nr:hypothetical protein NCU06822 [Neurospora crassa OR74A]EAA34427.2 hypothetical protein NCU06822 [Neurospora crassa OR74A]KHE87611.1 hypothetical protein GE21DRAFT_3074 [Neurospora crassa]CAD21212.1 hypothetical protein [Neurospora crassa]|eukprot:XP_963663.2 hypothetical protein NCU06822 [Neurospora crassa OR74A]
MADANTQSSRRGCRPRKRARIDSYLEDLSPAEESNETAEVVPEAPPTKKKGPEQGNERHMPCGPCVTRAFTTPGQKCYNQGGLGVACWQCAKNNHQKTCVPVPLHIHSKLKAWWDQNRTEKEDDSRTKAFVEELQNIIREIRAHNKGGVQPPLSATPGSSSAGQSLFTTLPRNSPHTETAEEKEYSIRKVEAFEAIANSAAKSAEALSLLVKNTDQMKDGLKYVGSDDAEEEQNCSPSPSRSTEEESLLAVKDHYISLLSERYDSTDKPLISISDRDALLALAAARDGTIGGLLQRKYIVASTRYRKERSRRTSGARNHGATGSAVRLRGPGVEAAQHRLVTSELLEDLAGEGDDGMDFDM